MGILEGIAEQLRRLQEAVAQLTAEARASVPKPVYPPTTNEEVWADGAMTVKEACEFLRVKGTKLSELIRSGEIVSAIDGRRLIAKRGCIRYLLAHQEHASE